MTDRLPFPSPDALDDPAALLVRMIDFHRATVVHKLRGLSDADLRATRIPSGWTPLELAWHLLHMERRWLQWGFLAQPTAAPWGDHAPQERGRWQVPDEVGVDDVAAGLEEARHHTTAILLGHPLATLAAVGGRFPHDPPTLAAIGLHVLQEYARHVGHLDIACELAGGPVGE